MHNLLSKMTRIEAICKSTFAGKMDAQDNLFRYPNLPKTPDCQVIAIALAAELEGIKSENALFAYLALNHPVLLQSLPCRQSYNRRCKHLRDWIDELACQLSDALVAPGQTLLVDSTKLPVCRFARAPRLRICADQGDMLPAYGYSATDKNRYFGFKLHLACCEQGVVVNYFISPANETDLANVVGLIGSLTGPCEALGDKAYISKPIQLDLFENHQVKLITDLRKNQRDISQLSAERGAKRMRVETTFSQLIDQFNLRRNYAKTTRGLFTRITGKIAAMTLLQYANISQGLLISRLQNSPAI